MADKVLEEVTKVDRASMNKVQTEEKTVLPDAEGKIVQIWICRAIHKMMKMVYRFDFGQF